MKPTKSYQELIVWQRAMELVDAVYLLVRRFPDEEKYGLVSQMRRAVVSIPANISEGRYRGTRKDFLRFLAIAYGSGAELETLIRIAKRNVPVRTDNYAQTDGLLLEVMKMLNAMIRSMRMRRQI